MSKMQRVPVQLPALVIEQTVSFAAIMGLDLNACVEQALTNWLNDVACPMVDSLIEQQEKEGTPASLVQ